MKTTITILFIGLNHFASAQCKLLDYITDTVELNGAKVIYYESDTSVKIKYGNDSFIRDFPAEYSQDCENHYIPGIWRPRWSNSRYIGFTSGCGSFCFGNKLAPLNVDDPFVEAGQILMDTANTVYFSLYHDTVDFSPYLLVENFNTNEVQKFALRSKDFRGAILLERLDYEESRSQGFTYENRTLTLYVKRKRDKVDTRTFKIDI